LKDKSRGIPESLMIPNSAVSSPPLLWLGKATLQRSTSMSASAKRLLRGVVFGNSRTFTRFLQFPRQYSQPCNSVHVSVFLHAHQLIQGQPELLCRRRYGWHVHKSLHRLSRDEVRVIALKMDLCARQLHWEWMQHTPAECRRRSGILTGDLLAVIDSWPEEQRLRGSQAIEEVEAEVIPRLFPSPIQ